ncbi:MAG: hypothetical protein WC455_10375 [Dehalococcoidia bacterium]|jgi:hypothetical protein
MTLPKNLVLGGKKCVKTWNREEAERCSECGHLIEKSFWFVNYIYTEDKTTVAQAGGRGRTKKEAEEDCIQMLDKYFPDWKSK